MGFLLQWHSELLEDHISVPVDKYNSQAMKLQVVYCTTHTDMPYVMGCESCLNVYCVQCMTGKDLCEDGELCYL